MWLSEGDRDFKYFYRKASNGQCKNHITKLLDENGVWQEGTKLDSLVIENF